MYRLRLLGPTGVLEDEQPVRPLESRKALALLCYLAVRRQPVSRAHLAELFWDGKTEAQGRANLSWTLHNILSRWPGCLQSTRQSVEFRPKAPYWLDLLAFEEYIDRGDPAALAAAAELYRGDFMAEFSLDDAPEFDMWLLNEREIWRQRVIRALQTLVAYHTDRREYGQGIDYARRLLKLEPWREEIHRCMMTLLAWSGQRNSALAQYEVCRRILAEDLGVEPESETTALYGQIRSGALAARAAAKPARRSQAAALQPRQLTVMSCELVGMLALAEALSFDKLDEVLRTCRQALVDVIQGEDGYVAQYRSSGMLVYFGFPQPQEDAPRRAIQAGLDLTKVVRYYSERLQGESRRKAPVGASSAARTHRQEPELTIRVGIHTGPVVESTGDAWFGALSVMGEPLIRAERLQSVASPNSVVINSATHSLVQDVFDCVRLGTQSLERLDRPMTLYKVVGVKHMPNERPKLRLEPTIAAV
ncbi:MAG: BTAD domain-containing putative transcriptional regulator [Anaerolineae bacterium]